MACLCLCVLLCNWSFSARLSAPPSPFLHSRATTQNRTHTFCRPYHLGKLTHSNFLQAFHAYDPDDTGQVDLANVMDLLDSHKTRKHGSDTEKLKNELSNRNDVSKVKDKHHVTFAEFCAALKKFADDANAAFGKNLEETSGPSHKKAFKVTKDKEKQNELTASLNVSINELNSESTIEQKVQ